MNKPKIDEKYMKRRIDNPVLSSYIKSTYGEDTKVIESSTIFGIEPFLQKNYGEDGDCTLVSILTVVKFYKPELDTEEAYNYIEKIAKKYLYTGTIGTFPLFNKSIIKKVFEHYKINKNIIQKLLKGIGFNADVIIDQIKRRTPVIISITNDGRNYYKNHTITIFGYSIYKTANGKKKILFKVYDNWVKVIAYLDYQLLREDCSICY